MQDPALKSDRIQGILFVEDTNHISYHRRMIDRMNQIVGIKGLKKRSEYHHYVSNNQDDLQNILDQFKVRD